MLIVDRFVLTIANGYHLASFNLTLEMLIVDRDIDMIFIDLDDHRFNLTLEMLIVDRATVSKPVTARV